MEVAIEEGLGESVLAQTMKAIVQHEYGTADVLTVGQIDKPKIGDGNVLVRVRAADVSIGDAHVMSGKPYLIRVMGFGLFRPKHVVPGMALAGTVEAIGKDVTSFEIGDEVYGELEGGAYAEHVAAPAKALAMKPKNLTFAQAAAVPGSASTALQGLRDVGRLQAGQRVLINGASGGVGTFAVQIAKALGATVTAVCSTRNVDIVRSLGADHVIDYTSEDFAECGERYDVVFDVVGNRTLADIKRVLADDGTYVSCGGEIGSNWLGPVVWLLRIYAASFFSEPTLKTFITTPNKDLNTLTELIESGAVTPRIHRQHELSSLPEAMRQVAAGHSQGKTVVTI